MAKKPADSDSDETGSDEASGSEAGSGSEEAGASSDASEASSDETEAHDAKVSPSKKTGKQAAVKSTKVTQVRPAPAAARPRGSGHELVPVICSECYEDLVFDSGVPSEELTCPICDHQAARPDDAQLAVIADKRGQEKTGFIIGLVLCLLAIGCFGFWLMAMRNPHTNPAENGGMFYGPSFGAGLLAVACLGFAVGKYEGNRHDVYF